MKRGVLVSIALLLLLACGSERTAEDTPPVDSSQIMPRPATEPSDTSETVADTPAPPGVSNPPFSIPVLSAVRAAIHDGKDRIVFEFNGPLPPYKLEYIDRPVRECGSGDVAELPGDAWLSIRFSPANAHTEAGEASVPVRDLSFTGRNLMRLKLICDFEAVVEWVAAVASPKRYNVLELKAPDRLVIDLEKGE